MTTDQTSAGAAPETGPRFRIPDDSPGFRLAERVAWHLLEKMAEDVVILDLRGSSDVCDFFVVAEGASAVQVKALARHLHDALSAAGHRAQGLEGMHEGRWALLDFFDVVVHIFHPDARSYYQLERLWGDAGRLEIEPAWFASPEVAARHPDVTFLVGGEPGPDR